MIRLLSFDFIVVLFAAHRPPITVALIYGGGLQLQFYFVSH